MVRFVEYGGGSGMRIKILVYFLPILLSSFLQTLSSSPLKRTTPDSLFTNPTNETDEYHDDGVLFGVGIEAEKDVEFSDGHMSILEGSNVGLRLFGIFTPGAKLRFSRNGYSCDIDSLTSKEFKIDLEKTSVRGRVHEYSYGRVDGVGIPIKGDMPQIYFCIYSPPSDSWIAQGTSRGTFIEVRSKLLPLWLQILLIITLLLFSGLFSGLNLGLMSLNKTDLKIIINTGSASEREHASKIAPVRNHGNFLLCSLLFSNVLVNSTLTILTDSLTSGIFAIIFSTLAIVVFGEIIPQAICSRHGLAIGAKSIYVTKFFMGLTFPLAYPISLILDKFLGEEIGSVYTRERLKELLKVTKDHHGLENEEVALISGALDMKTKTVRDIMTRLETVFMLPLDSYLDYDTMAEIESQGYTRIPVYDGVRNNVVAVLNIKQLTLLDASDSLPMRTVVEYYQNNLFYVFENTRLDYMFRAFREGNRGHMAFVQKVNDEGPGDPFYETIGVVTMEDVLEELLQADIQDETDVGKFKARMESKNGRRKEVPFFSKNKERGRGGISIPPPLRLATTQFLTTAVPAFDRKIVSEAILIRLMTANVFIAKPPRVFNNTIPRPVYIYENGKAADYFVVILEGRVEVEVGAENLVFQTGPFQCFGAEFLLSQPSQENILEFKNPPPIGSNIGFRKYNFTPDYSVRVVTETFFVRIRYGAYRAACIATEMEKKYADPRHAAHNENWRRDVEDILNVVDEDSYGPQRRIIYTGPIEDEESEGSALIYSSASTSFPSGEIKDKSKGIFKPLLKSVSKSLSVPNASNPPSTPDKKLSLKIKKNDSPKPPSPPPSHTKL